MKLRSVATAVVLVLALLAGGLSPATAMLAPDRALVQIVPKGAGDLALVEEHGVPVFAHVVGREGAYLLAGATLRQIDALRGGGLTVRLLDDDIAGTRYYLAQPAPGRAQPDWSAAGRLLLDDGIQVVLRATAEEAERLAQAGVQLAAVTFAPKPLRPRAETAFPAAVDPDPLIQQMVDQVQPSLVSQLDRELAGELPVWVDGAWYTIPSRYTYSGTPIEKTMHYVGQRLAGTGLEVEYHQWGGASYPNVIGERSGLLNPEDVFIIGAHIDDVQGTPGADDNASGSVATLLAADILTQYDWGCTLRFALWTGEEQGLNGSEAYAQRASQNGENILGYLNLDMIAWNTPGSPKGIDLYYNSGMPPTLQLAQLFADVVDAYNLDLVPQLATGVTGSDHASFWQYGYTAILGIEDNGDFNPYYHGPGDTPAHTDLPYFTDFVKASVATFAHMTGCLIPSGIGTLDGHVTAASGGAPIAGAQLTMADGQGHTYTATGDAAGYYSRTLLADTYTVGASAYGYQPATVGGVVVLTDTITTQDFALETAPVYQVSGDVTDLATGAPLEAQVEFEGSPVTVWTDPSTGHYAAGLAQGSYTMQVTAAGHRPQTRAIVVDQGQVQDFALEPLPCILLVDDDNDSPDTRPYFASALDAMGYDYDVVGVAGGGDGPDLAALQGYKMVFWFSGDKFGGSAGPSGSDEAHLAGYLDGGGNLFLSSQDYLYDFGLTPFGSTYLGIASFSSDTGDATSIVGLAGDPIGGGLGPFSLTYPSDFSEYGDIVNPAAGASTPFKANNNANKLDTDKAGANWKTVFFGTDWVPLYNNNAANGLTVLQRIVDWFGGCQPPAAHSLHVNALKMNSRAGMPPYYKAIALLRIHDEAHALAAGVTVQGAWTFPDGQEVQQEAVSDSLGRAKFRIREAQCGTYEFCVTGMVKAGFAYDPAANEQGPCKTAGVMCQ